MSLMDPTTAIEALRASTEAGFRDLRVDLTNRLDQNVTRREHDAEVKRLDSERAALAERHADLEKRHSALEEHADLEHADIRDALRQDQEERREIADKAERRRVSDRRWYIGITIAAVSAVGALIGTIVSIFAR